jgi:vacuolar-type H+-ATPase catalytic subunit A/Vma1
MSDENTFDPQLKEELEAAIKLLKEAVKHSSSTDEFRHMDLTLVPAAKRAKYESALMVVRRCIHEGFLTQDQFDTAVGFK